MSKLNEEKLDKVMKALNQNKSKSEIDEKKRSKRKVRIRADERKSKRRINEYQGWANWETWATNLQLVNSYGPGVVDDLIRVADDGGEEAVKDYVWDNILEVDRIRDPLTDEYVSGCFREVDWREITESFIEMAEGEY